MRGPRRPSNRAQFILALAALAASQAAPAAHAEVPPTPPGWTLEFADDFEGPAGTLPSATRWRFSIGHGYPGGPENWGTGEIAYHTDDPANVSVDGDGNLEITPLRDQEGDWTSARIETNRQDFRPPPGGVMRIEGQLKLPDVSGPSALGYWPAFWILGSPFRDDLWSWPTIGEIDIMENVNGADTIWGVLHCGVSPGGPCQEPVGLDGTTACPSAPCAGSTRRYTFEWDASVTPSQLRWYIDGEQYHQVSEGEIPADTWQDMAGHGGYFMILNIAIGGGFPDGVAGFETPTEDTVPGHAMSVDYVAVWLTEPEGAPDLRLSVTPRRPAVSAGRGVRFEARVRNAGDGAAAEVRVCASAPESKARVVGRRCATGQALEPEASFAPKFELRPRRRARGKQVRVGFTASSPGLEVERASATLRVRRARRR
jgi:Glycosyl hydrolases family 16